MKTRNLQSLLLAIAAITAFAFTAGNIVAQDSTATTQPVATSQPAPQLSYGVPQVLQLVQAKVSDGIIVSYIQNSGTIYSLNAGEIVYLKQQGVSDPVLNAMLNQRSRLTGSTEPATTTASSPAATAQVYTPATPAPAVTYDQSAVAPSTVYVIPDTQTYYYDDSYPYYYPYYGGYYGWPVVSLGFGWGGYYGGGYGYGYYGGGYHGGGVFRSGGGSGGFRSGGGGGGFRGGGGGFHGGGGGGGFRGGGGGFHH